MDMVINATFSTCPQFPGVGKIVENMYNNFPSYNISQLAIIACEAERLKALNTFVNSINLYYIYKFGFFIGTLGGILSLCSYIFVKKFNATAFYYYRAINAFDLIYLITYLCSSFGLWDNSTPVRRGFVILVKNITKNAGKSSRLLVTWLAIERSVACHWPNYYSRIDRKRVAVRVIFGCLALALTYNSPTTYYDVATPFYGVVSPDLQLAIFDRVFRGCEGLAMLILMPLVIAGFVSMSRRKRSLISNNEVNTLGGKARLNKINLNQWLCLLQLCEGIPAVLNTIVIYISYVTNFTGVTRNTSTYKNVSYDENVSYQKLFEIQQYSVIIVTAIDCYNHAGHFYTYFLCSPTFRRTLLNAVKRKFIKRVESVT